MAVLSSEEIKEREREIVAMSEVSLVIDNYDEIFSSFDPRPFSQRALSVDFLDEARRATRELRDDAFQLRFLLPAEERRLERESIIRRRLKEHFKKHHDLLEKDRKEVVRQGILFLAFGFLCMFLGAFVLFHYGHNVSLLKEILVVVFQPAGWFLFWEGLDLIIFSAKEKKPDLEFYRKMTKAEIIFMHY